MAINAEFILIRDPVATTRANVTTMRSDLRAITRGAAQARPGVALLRGLLLLSVP
jgi:hypothetical protein